jgi:hypothetical protein
MLTWHQANSYPFLAKAMLNKLLKILLNQVNTCPNPLLHALERWQALLLHELERWQAYYSPRLPNKAQKQESFRWDKKLWVS